MNDVLCLSALVFLIILGIFAANVQGQTYFFEDTTADDFEKGEFYRTKTAGDNVVLEEGPSGYYQLGTFNSTEFDAGFVVNWESVSWDETLFNQTIKLKTIVSDDGVSWFNESGYYTNHLSEEINASNTRYIRYIATLETDNTSITPYLESVKITYSLIEPTVMLESPEDDNTSTTGNVVFNCSVSSVNSLVNATLYWNYSGIWTSDDTKNLTGNQGSAVFNKTNLDNGTYVWNCLVYDSAGAYALANMNRTINIKKNITNDTISPIINYYSIDPKTVSVDENVSLSINASDESSVDSVWAVITLPDTSTERIDLVNNGTVNYTTVVNGTHNVTFFANDTSGNEDNASDSFFVNETVNLTGKIYFNVSVYDHSQSGLLTNLTIYNSSNGVKVYDAQSFTGMFKNQELEGGLYDFLFGVFDSEFHVLLLSIDIEQNTEREMWFDKTQSSDLLIYAVKSEYTANGASFKVFYDEGDFINESYLSLYECDDWDFSAQACDIEWENASTYQSKTGDYFEVDLNLTGNFTIAFSLIQESLCGDGVCDSSEDNVSCPDDCECITDSNRTCGTTDVGACEFGMQFCIDGKWGECNSTEPENETCDGIDNNCDGAVDEGCMCITGEVRACGSNIGECSNGTWTCVGGQWSECIGAVGPEDEICDGLNNDCDDKTDEGCECITGEVRACGSNIGECSNGTWTCINGQWSECVDEIGATDELCDGLDNDCDGKVDEICENRTVDTCNNGIQDGDEEGIDCGGSCPTLCPEFPWFFLTVIGIIMILVFSYNFGLFGKLKQKFKPKSKEKKKT